jgi:hypothetical protein
MSGRGRHIALAKRARRRRAAREERIAIVGLWRDIGRLLSSDAGKEWRDLLCVECYGMRDEDKYDSVTIPFVPPVDGEYVFTPRKLS